MPNDSTGVQATPMLPFVPNQPFLSGSASVSNLEAGKAYLLDLRYVRLSEAAILPAASAAVAAAQPVSQDTAGRVTLNNLPYILGGVGVVLILSASYYFWQSKSAQTSKPRKRIQNAQGENTVIYCQECGTRALTEDRFCRACGSKLRVR